MKIALLQHACGPDVNANVDTAVALMRDAAGRGAELLITQELFTGVYFPQAEDPERFDLAETIPGPTTRRLSALAHELGVHIHASMFERRAPGLYHNTSVLIDPRGEQAALYRKMHIPDDPSFFEKFYFTPGDRGWQVAEVNGLPVGMLVCWDQWFPEAARLTALRGAQLIVYPTAIGYLNGEPVEEQQRQREAWITIQRSHAIANGLFVAAVNRVGTEGELTFWGGSFVAEPGGQIIAQAGEREEAALVVEVDVGRIEAVRRMWPFLRDRRIDAYAAMTRRYLDAGDALP